MKDPIENSEEYLKIKDNLEKIIEIIMKNKGIKEDDICYIDVYWNVKKELLRELFNINWKSPKDLNPNIIFN